MTRRADSRAAQIRKAEKVLRALLQTPKSRSGLIAAVSVTNGITRNYVFGWLAARHQDGTVTKIRLDGSVVYQMTQKVVEAPKESEFPGWMDPRGLPMQSVRRVFIQGKQVRFNQEQEQQKDEK